jgi:hypothetical protein
MRKNEANGVRNRFAARGRDPVHMVYLAFLVSLVSLN